MGCRQSASFRYLTFLLTIPPPYFVQSNPFTNSILLVPLRTVASADIHILRTPKRRKQRVHGSKPTTLTRKSVSTWVPVTHVLCTMIYNGQSLVTIFRP